MKQESSRRDAEYLSLVQGPLFSGWSMDGKVLVGVAVGIRTKIFPRFWECRSDGGELEVWREGTDNFVLSNSSFCCLVINRGVQSGSVRDRSSRERTGGWTKGVI